MDDQDEALKEKFLDGDKMDVFTLETNVRKMIRDLIQPVLTRAHQDRTDMEILKGKIEEFDTKYQEIYRVVFNRPKEKSKNK